MTTISFSFNTASTLYSFFRLQGRFLAAPRASQRIVTPREDSPRACRVLCHHTFNTSSDSTAPRRAWKEDRVLAHPCQTR